MTVGEEEEEKRLVPRVCEKKLPVKDHYNAYYGKYTSGSIFVCNECTILPGGRETKLDATLRHHRCTSESLLAFRLKIPPAKD